MSLRKILATALNQCFLLRVLPRTYPRSSMASAPIAYVPTLNERSDFLRKASEAAIFALAYSISGHFIQRDGVLNESTEDS